MTIPLGDVTTPVVIAANFTADPVLESFDFWMRRLGLSSRGHCAPFDQIFQQLLDPSSEFAQNVTGVNVVLVRLDRWTSTDSRQLERSLERNVEELADALARSADLSGIRHILLVCPPAPAVLEVPETARLLAAAETALCDRLARLSGVEVVRSTELFTTYPVSPYYDPVTDQLGEIPYTPAAFAALGTLLARRVYAARRPPIKVLALDCDDTLWGGVCGEVGPTGLTLDESHLALQRRVVDLQRAGLL
ncbi:MAG: HAD-IIIC family phosphatase, partial [Gemmatimonadales bacterium]